MAAEREFKFGPRELPCGKGSRLIIALERDDPSPWAVVYYKARFVGDHFPKRFAITKPVLLDAVRVLFAEADEPFDADALIAYVLSTSWGMALPRVSAERKPVPMPQDERLADEYPEAWRS